MKTKTLEQTIQDTTTLEGNDLMGRIYDVREGRIARANSVEKTQLFNFSKTMKTVYIGGIGEFEVSEDFIVDTNFEHKSGSTETEIFQSEDVENSFSVNIGISGSTGTFSGEMSSCYSQTTENNYASSMNLAKQFSQYTIYKMMMSGDTAFWRSRLQEDVAKDINGSMEAEELVQKYGTHFLASGYFGGVWMYAQSISKYTATTETEVAETLSASAEYEGVKVDGSATNESSTKNTQSESQTNLFVDIIGGTSTKSYDDWEDSVNEGNWNLVAFDNKTDISLQLLSVLVDPSIENYADRVASIDAAIKLALTPYQLTTLTWEPTGDRKTLKSGKVEKSFILNPETESNMIITGLAFKVDDSNVVVFNAYLLNMDTGIGDWYTTDEHGNHVIEPQDNTQSSRMCDKGYVLTGLGLNASDSEMYNMELYGQAIDVMDYNSNCYLGYNVKKFGDANPECTYKPVDGNENIITGIEVGVYHGNIGALYLQFGKFKKVTVAESIED